MRAAIAIPPSHATEAAGIAQIARIKALAMLGRGDPVNLAEQMGSARVKAVVSALSTGNTSGMVDAQIIVGAFLQQMRNSSAFVRLLDAMVRIPFRSRVSLVAADATGWILGEGKPIPVDGVTLDNLDLTPEKAATLLVLTEELLRGTQSERNLSLALRRGITAAVDRRFLAAVIDPGTALPSEGGTVDDAVSDIRNLLEAVDPTVESSLLFVMSPEVQRGAATIRNASGAFQFLNLTPTGGEILGIPAMPSDQMQPGSLALIDATGIAGEVGDIAIDASEHATIEMLNSALQQDATAGTPAPNLVSMFQTNSVAIRAVLDFAAERLRDQAVAMVTGITWAEPTP
jgi:HK97 family phage major capsid protein